MDPCLLLHGVDLVSQLLHGAQGRLIWPPASRPAQSVAHALEDQRAHEHCGQGQQACSCYPPVHLEHLRHKKAEILELNAQLSLSAPVATLLNVKGALIMRYD